MSKNLKIIESDRYQDTWLVMWHDEIVGHIHCNDDEPNNIDVTFISNPDVEYNLNDMNILIEKMRKIKVGK